MTHTTPAQQAPQEGRVMTERIYNEALAKVNELRGERGMEPLSALPKGVPGDAAQCCIARALSNGHKARFHPDSRLVIDDVTYEAPKQLTVFAVAFDKHHFPELIGYGA